jgi:uncharacterized membrane protein (DUF373 family)
MHEKKHHYRRERVQAVLHEIAFYLELIAALLVVILILFQTVGLCIDMFSDVSRLTDSDLFTHFLELALNIVVGIEFLKMLCRHNMDAVIEVLLFTLARHLIVNQHSMVEGLLCIVAISLLFVVRKYLFVPKIDKVTEPEDTPKK